jgi:hypothetical protein
MGNNRNQTQKIKCGLSRYCTGPPPAVDAIATLVAVASILPTSTNKPKAQNRGVNLQVPPQPPPTHHPAPAPTVPTAAQSPSSTSATKFDMPKQGRGSLTSWQLATLAPSTIMSIKTCNSFADLFLLPYFSNILTVVTVC